MQRGAAGHRRAFIARGKVTAHRAAMVAAFVTSSLFLFSYPVLSLARAWRHRVFPRDGMGAGSLLDHLDLAHDSGDRCGSAGADHAHPRLRGQFDRHRAIARWTFPIWLYVSVTGVIVYLMLFQMFA